MVRRWARLVGALVMSSTIALPALGAELRLVPEEEVVVGRDATLLIVVSDEGRPLAGEAPVIEVDRGSVSGRDGEIAPGVWRVRYRAPETSAPPPRFVLSVEGGRASTTLDLRSATAPEGRLTVKETAYAGQTTPVLLRLEGPDLPPAELLEVAAPEGEIVLVRAAGDAREIEWLPGPEPFPRAVPIGIRDGRGPQASPWWTVVPVRARPRLPLRTDDPGSQVTVFVSGRRYGPVTTGSDGMAQVTAEVRPGETTAEVLTVDSLGNERRSPLSLGGELGGAIVGLVSGVQGVQGITPVVHLHAVESSGRPLKGAAPTCTSSLGHEARIVSTGPGIYEASLPSLPSDAFFDVRLDCTVDQRARTSLRIPVEATRPARVVVQAFPEELSADLPVAQLQAYLESSSGTRVGIEALSLAADLGEIVALPNEGGAAALRAEYRGEAAVAAGRDTVHAAWDRPLGSGPPWTVTLGTLGGPEALVITAQAADVHGLPLAGATFEVTLDGQTYIVAADDRGWARLGLPPLDTQGPWDVRVQTGEVSRRSIVFSGGSVGRTSTGADLSGSVDLVVASGRVRQVLVTTEPRVLPTGSGSQARVLVRLEDAQGQPVTDAQIELVSDSGVVTRPKLRGDGTWEATYAPPPGQPTGTVQITAEGRNGSFAATTTVLELVPRPTRGSVGLGLGYLVGNRGLSSPFLQLQGRGPVPGLSSALHGVLGMGFYSVTATTQDLVTAEEIQLELDLLPLELGAMIRQDRGARGAWLGSTLVVAPFRLVGRFGDLVPARGIGVAPPGFHPFTGAGWRVGSSELQIEAGYTVLSMSSEDLGWQGAVGGFVVTLGYTLHL